jgi:hypothetical protein
MAPLALAMFIAMFAFGDQIFGWPQMTQQIQLALFAAFTFGIICGYRTRA